jgi:hypothetical protein
MKLLWCSRVLACLHAIVVCWACGVMASTRDSESLNPGSNPGRPCQNRVLCVFIFKLI